MLELVSVTPKFAAGPQMSGQDFAFVRDAGFLSVLNVRPDDEIGDYLAATDAAAIARANGLEYAHSPTENHEVFEEDAVDRFEQALARLPQPVFAHCKSGTRAVILWAMVAARHRDVEDVIETLRSAGQDLDFLEQELRDSADAARRSPLRLKDDALLSLGRSGLMGLPARR